MSYNIDPSTAMRKALEAAGSPLRDSQKGPLTERQLGVLRETLRHNGVKIFALMEAAPVVRVKR